MSASEKNTDNVNLAGTSCPACSPDRYHCPLYNDKHNCPRPPVFSRSAVVTFTPGTLLLSCSCSSAELRKEQLPHTSGSGVALVSGLVPARSDCPLKSLSSNIYSVSRSLGTSQSRNRFKICKSSSDYTQRGKHSEMHVSLCSLTLLCLCLCGAGMCSRVRVEI